MNKKIVLTGGSGHLGYNIGKILIKKKYKILLILRRHNTYTNELIRLGAKFRIVNFQNIKISHLHHFQSIARRFLLKD